MSDIKQPSSRGSRAFTLVEMLGVMGIIIVLLGICLPVVRGYNVAEGRHSAVASVMATLDRARMMAISDGLSTYVVFFATNTPPTGTQASPNAFGRAYAIFEDDNNIDFTPVQQTPWMYLPSSMAFKVSSSNYLVPTVSITNRNLTSTDPSFTVAPAVLTASASEKIQLPYLKFDNTGVADEQQAQYLRVLMFPGSVTPAGVEVTTQTAGTQAAQIALLEEIDIDPATGRPKYVANPVDNFSTTPGSQ
jgi:type II secretory pathway pseudopilin PulG